MSSRVTVTLPNNVTFTANDRTYREGDVFEVERDELVDAHIRNGHLVEVKKKKA